MRYAEQNPAYRLIRHFDLLPSLCWWFLLLLFSMNLNLLQLHKIGFCLFQA